MESKKVLTLIILILIILFAFWLRFVNLESNPHGLYVDEASTGVNAFSILKTSRDEYGKEFPLAFKFLGSYTPPVYTYLTALSIHLFGYSISSIRLVSVVSGMLLVPLFFVFLTKLGIGDFRTKLLGTFLMAITPWLIFYSRIGYEVNLAFLLFSLGVLFLWLSIKNKRWFVMAAGLLSLSSNVYHTERLLAPLLIITFLILFRKNFLIRKNIKLLALTACLYLIILLPQLLIFFTPANTSRGFGLFYQTAILNQANQISLPLFLAWTISFVKEFLSQYFAYFSPRNLFFQPDSDLQRSLPDLSVFYPWMVVLYVTGLYFLIKERIKIENKFISLLLFLSPVPAALTGDPFSSQRALPLFLPVMLIMVIGLNKLTSRSKLRLIVISAVSLFSLVLLYRSYAVLLPNERAATWGYGFKQLAQEIQKRPNEKFLIDDGRVKPVYIELAFYLKIPPEKLQQVVDPKIKEQYYQNTKWNGHYVIDNFETRAINWEEDIYKDQILVGDGLSISESQANEHFLIKVFEIRGPLNEIIFSGYQTNPKIKCQQSKSSLCHNV